MLMLWFQQIMEEVLERTKFQAIFSLLYTIHLFIRRTDFLIFT